MTTAPMHCSENNDDSDDDYDKDDEDDNEGHKRTHLPHTPGDNSILDDESGDYDDDSGDAEYDDDDGNWTRPNTASASQPPTPSSLF